MEAIKNIKEKFNNMSIVAKVVIGLLALLFLATLTFGGYKGYQYVSQPNNSTLKQKGSKNADGARSIPDSAPTPSSSNPSNGKSVKRGSSDADSADVNESDAASAPKAEPVNGQLQQDQDAAQADGAQQ